MNVYRKPISSLGDRRLADHALSASPAWIWTADGQKILWANPAGAAMFGATPAEVPHLHFESSAPLAAQIARLAGTLPAGDGQRLERLRGLGNGIGGALTCHCARIALEGEPEAIMIVAIDRAGAPPPFDTRLRAVLAEIDGTAAAFTEAGKLLQATAQAERFLGDAVDLEMLGATALAQAALRDGHAEGDLETGCVTLKPLRADKQNVLLVIFSEKPMTAATPAAAPAAATVAAARTDSQRFIWQTDAAGRFTIEPGAFLHRADTRTAALSGQRWSTFSNALGIDPDGRIAAALASHETWNGIAASWPAARGGRITVELSGLPVFDRDRNFTGYRGFGLCRDGAVPGAEAPAADLAALPPQLSAEPAPPPAAGPPQAEAPEPAPTVVPLRTQALSPGEQSAFHELARALGERLKSNAGKPLIEDDFGPERPEAALGNGADAHAPAPPARETPPAANAGDERPILDKLPVGILVYRYNTLIYANRALLDWTGYRSLDALSAAGGLDSLFIEPAAGPGTSGGGNGAKSLAIATRDGNSKPVEGRLFSVSWDGENALVLMINTLAGAPREAAPDKSQELARREIEAENRSLRAALDTAADGVLLLDAAGRIIFANNSAAALFGRERDDLDEMAFAELFAPESRRAALDYLDRLGRDPTAGIINPGKEMVARTGRGGLIPLHITIGPAGADGEKFCAVLRDITAQKKAEEELLAARQRAEATAAEKSEFLAKISHDIRTPLNAIIGFSEVMMEQRFGPIGNERYQDYIGGIHAAGGRLVALLNDLLDLAKIETGKLDLAMTQLNLNDITQQCVAALQPQANRERVIIRTSLPPNLPTIVADARAVRQIVLNLLSHSIKYSGAGGQIIVSTARTDKGEVALRVRDSGAAMSDRELLNALEPFRNLATSARWGASGTGLDLPITKALAEANRATFTISSGAEQGTLVEVAFPAIRVIA